MKKEDPVFQCTVCGYDVVSWHWNGLAQKIDDKVYSLNGAEMKDIHYKCLVQYELPVMEKHDWGVPNAEPMDNGKEVIDIFRELQKMYRDEYRREQAEQHGLGGRGGIVQLDAVFGQDADGNSLTFADMQGTPYGVNKAWDYISAWVAPIETDKRGDERSAAAQYSNGWQAIVWEVRKRHGYGYRRLHQYLQEVYPDAAIPHENTIANWLDEWYAEGDAMETRMREEGAPERPWYDIKQMNARDTERFVNMCTRFMKLYKALMNLKEPEKDRRYTKLQELYNRYIEKEREASSDTLGDAMDAHRVKKLGRLWSKLSGRADVPEHLRGDAQVSGVPLPVCVYFDLVDWRTVARLEGKSPAHLRIIQDKLEAQWEYIRHIPRHTLSQYARMYRHNKKSRG
jgi:hypothetical protein